MSETQNKEITAEQLVEVLKFTPRKYTVSMWGYGGEKVMGTVGQDVWNYCQANHVDLQDIAWDSDAAEELGLDPEKLPFYPGSWYECDSMGHVSGVSRDAGTIQVLDENGDTVFERSLESCDGMDGSPELCCNDEVWIGSRSRGEIVFVGSSNEKGTFFEGEIELTAPFDIEKLQIHYDDFDEEDIVNGLYYNDEEIENYGGSTDGKSSDFVMVRLTDDQGNFERYDPDAEVDACSSEEWDPAKELDKIVKEHLVTDWFPMDVKPVHKGEYECEFLLTTWPWPSVRMCEWTGKLWKDNGEKIKGEFKWRGLQAPATEYITIED